MTIEIKKTQLKVLTVIAAMILCVGGGYALYSLGYSNGHKEGFKEGQTLGVAQTKKKYEHPKGDGSTWYAETINNCNDMLYHSTLACPYIKNGINKNTGFTDPNYRKQHSQFCSKCMDSNLIIKCQEYLYDDKSWD